MGSDLYMESHNFRPRKTIAYINRAGRIELYRDFFYTGYKKVPGSYENTPEIRDLIRRLDGTVEYVDKRPV